MNDTNSFLETSVTAMFLTSIVRGVRGGVLDRDEYALTFPNVHIEKYIVGYVLTET